MLKYHKSPFEPPLRGHPLGGQQPSHAPPLGCQHRFGSRRAPGPWRAGGCEGSLGSGAFALCHPLGVPCILGAEVAGRWCRPSKRSLVGAIWGGGLSHPPISNPSKGHGSHVSTYEAVGRSHEAHPHWRQRGCARRGLVQPAVLRASGHELGAQRLGVRRRWWWTLRSVTW